MDKGIELICFPELPVSQAAQNGKKDVLRQIFGGLAIASSNGGDQEQRSLINGDKFLLSSRVPNTNPRDQLQTVFGFAGHRV